MTPLRQRMLEDLQIRHYSPTTIRIYLHVIAEFARHFGKPPDELNAEHIRCYQMFLIKEKGIVAVYLHPDRLRAAVFLYSHTQPENRHGPHSLSTAGKKLPPILSR